MQSRMYCMRHDLFIVVSNTDLIFFQSALVSYHFPVLSI